MAGARVRSWLGAVTLGGLLGGVGVAAVGEPVVTCRVRDHAQGRVYRLAQPVGEGEPVWTLSMREGDGEWIDLALPRARPAFDGETVSLRFRNANGGRQIELDVDPAGSRLDVYVNYGLEVNIDRDLDPDVDEMNTGGPITALDCTIARP